VSICTVTSDRRAFTLVELLVVISIIALLIAILLPSLQRARDSAKQAACAANIRSIAQAGITYAADDPGENAIPVGPGAAELNARYKTYYSFGGKSGAGGSSIGTPVDRANSVWGANGSMDPNSRPLNHIIYKGGLPEPTPTSSGNWAELTRLDLDLFKCPGDKGFSGMHHQGWKASGLSSFDYYGTSYSAQPMWIGVYGFPGGDYIASNGIFLRPLSRVPNPANTIMYWENAARFATSFYFRDRPADQANCGCRCCLPPGGYSGPPYVAKGFHGRDWNFNIAFGDGHASFIKIQGREKTLGNQQMPLCKQGPPELCQCVIVRGPGWQLDTMPSPEIRTDYPPNAGRGALCSDDPDEIFSIVP